jgi:uncharacterized protein
MNEPRWCDFDRLESLVVGQFREEAGGVHGVAHWRRVEQHGLWLASRMEVDVLVVRLFAWFHDAKRENDYTDPDHDHGKRGGEFARSLRGELFDLEDAAMEKLVYACTWHTDRDFTDDLTIGTCWDADRLDLGRVGAIPSADFMNTPFGREVAKAGSFALFDFLPKRNEPGN